MKTFRLGRQQNWTVGQNWPTWWLSILGMGNGMYKGPGTGNWVVNAKGGTVFLEYTDEDKRDGISGKGRASAGDGV